MNQKLTTRFRQRMQTYLLLTVMTVSSLLASNSFAQTACTCTSSLSNLLTNASFEAATQDGQQVAAALHSAALMQYAEVKMLT